MAIAQNPFVRTVAQGASKLSKSREVILVAATAIGTGTLMHFLPERLSWGMSQTGEQPSDGPVATTDNDTDTGNSPAPSPEDEICQIVPLECGVTDEMSFGQAFGTAREALGAGQVFEWHGKLYNTFYKEEWVNMTPEEHQEFLASVDFSTVSHHDVPRHEPQPVDPVPAPVDPEPEPGPDPEPEPDPKPDPDQPVIGGDTPDPNPPIAVNDNDGGPLSIDLDFDGIIDAEAQLIDADNVFDAMLLLETGELAMNLDSEPGFDAVGILNMETGEVTITQVLDTPAVITTDEVAIVHTDPFDGDVTGSGITPGEINHFTEGPDFQDDTDISDLA